MVESWVVFFFFPSGFLGTYLSASSPAGSQVPQSHSEWFCKLPCSFTGRPPADSVYFGSSPLFFPFWRGRHRGRVGSICLGRPSALGFRPEKKERKKGRKEEMKKDPCSLKARWMNGEGETFWDLCREVRSQLCWMAASIGITASLLWVQQLSCVSARRPVYSLEWAPKTARQLGGDARPCQAIRSFLCWCQGYAEDKLSSLVAPINPKQNKNEQRGRKRNLLVVGV